jgi:hypothetical protein
MARIDAVVNLMEIWRDQYPAQDAIDMSGNRQVAMAQQDHAKPQQPDECYDEKRRTEQGNDRYKQQ